MNRSQAIALADAIMSIRPDWLQPGILAALHQLDQSWAGTDAGLYAHALTVAGNPNAHTPQAMNATPVTPTPTATADPEFGRQPTCHICGHSRPKCDKLRERDRTYNLDPHDFETLEEAEANASPRQLGDLLADIDTLRATRAKERADRARAEIRPTKFANRSALLDRRGPAPRKCAGCGGTLATSEDEYHPGCTPDQQEDQPA